MSDTIKELRELEAKATKGPWLCGIYTPSLSGSSLAKDPFSIHIEGSGPRYVYSSDDGRSSAMFGPDAELISAMRNSLLALLDFVELSRELAHHNDMTWAPKWTEALAKLTPPTEEKK